jgi:hypothetical protein
MVERWKPVTGFGIYEISDHGNIRSIDRLSRNWVGEFPVKGTMLRQQHNNRGYRYVRLWKDGSQVKKYVHRLVAEEFIPNPNNLPQINHLDNNPDNNHVSNLEWCTHEQNMKWSEAQGRAVWSEKAKQNARKGWERMWVPVVGENVITGEVLRFANLNDTKKSGFQPSCVCNCCKGLRKVHKGYRWSYEVNNP